MKRQSIKTLISTEFRKSFLALAIVFTSFFSAYQFTQFLKLKSNIETIVVEHAVSTVGQDVLTQDFFRVQLDLERFASTLNQDNSVTVDFEALADGRKIGESAKRGKVHFLNPISITTQKDLASGVRIEVRAAIYFESLLLNFLISLLVGIGFISGFYFLLQSKLSKSALQIADPLLQQINAVKDIANHLHEKRKQSPLQINSNVSEIEDLHASVNTLLNEISNLEEDVRVRSADQTRIEIAEKVAHDIVSPVAALRANLSQANLDSLTQANVAKSLSRIQEIVASLKTKSFSKASKPSSVAAIESKAESQNLHLLINDIAFEKQVKFSDRPDVILKFESNGLTSLFSKIDPSDFKRTLSNLLDNAFEAIVGDSGSITIALSKSKTQACIEIEDNGKGIEADLLPMLMTKGASFGKENGTGLGLYSSKQFIDDSRGTIGISSTAGKGTKVSLELPLSESPKSFASEIVLKPDTKIISVDDDSTVSSIWRMKLAEAKIDHSEKFLFFSNPHDFLNWFESEGKHLSDGAFYFDQELRGYDLTGKDLIRLTSLEAKSVIVSSHASQKRFQDECEKLGVRCLPKDLLFETPIRINWSHEDLNFKTVNQ